MKGVVPVAIVAWPKPTCKIPEMPESPELKGYIDPATNPSGPGGFDRYYLTLRQIEDVVEFHKQIRAWMVAFKKCAAHYVDLDESGED